MNNRLELFKEPSRILGHRQKSNTDRYKMKAERAKKRSDAFLCNRGIPKTPMPAKAHPPTILAAPQANIPVTSGAIDNQAVSDKENSQNKKLSSGETLPKDSSTERRQAYIRKYLAWKQTKGAAKSELKQSKPNIAQLEKSTKFAAPAMTSFAPENHQFRPPKIIQPGTHEQPYSENSEPNGKRPSIYNVTETPKAAIERKASTTKSLKAPNKSEPPRHNAVVRILRSHNIAKKLVMDAADQPSNREHKRRPLLPAEARTAKNQHETGSTTGCKSDKKTTNGVNAPIFAAPKTKLVKNTAKNGVLKPKVELNGARKAAESAPAAESKKRITRGTPSNVMNVPPLKPAKSATKEMPAYVASKCKAPPPNLVTVPFAKPAKPAPTRRVANAGAVGKTKSKEMAPKSAPKLVKTMKAKPAAKCLPVAAKDRPAVENKRVAPKRRPIKKLVNKPELIIAALQLPTPLPPAVETPLELNQDTNFPFLTSTQIKDGHSDNHRFVDSDGLSPVEFEETKAVTTRKRRSISAKRTLLKNELNKPPPGHKRHKNGKSKFLRYSDADLSFLSTPDEEEVTIIKKCENTPPKLLDVKPTEVSVAHQSATLKNELSPESTLTAEAQSPRPSNYLSPFVTVSRGKVNARTERLQRDSVYLKDHDVNMSENTQPIVDQQAILVLRAKETVQYFRNQLAAEIARLKELCTKWGEYRMLNTRRLQESGGDDMINAGIGQTNLLVSKKLKQFGELIDRCEAGISGAVNSGASENEKPVHADDLQGWWDMVKLQSENIDKRFATIDRWRLNDWQDPDDVSEPVVVAKNQKPQTAPKLSAAAKKAKPSSGLQQMLRKLQAEMRKNKAAEATTSAITTTKSPRLSGTRKVPTLVQNRRAFSHAPTILMLPTPNKQRRSSLAHENEPSGAVLITPKSQIRRSILKTPGSTKDPSKRVLFSAKKTVRKFTIEEEHFSDDEEAINEKGGSLCDSEPQPSAIALEEDSESCLAGQSLGSYVLRTRTVALRPSYELLL